MIYSAELCRDGGGGQVQVGVEIMNAVFSLHMTLFLVNGRGE